MSATLLKTLMTLMVLTASASADFDKHTFYSQSRYGTIPKQDLDVLFEGLDLDKNGLIDKSDWTKVYRNPRAAPDIEKFFVEVDGSKDSAIQREEYDKFMSDQSVVFAVGECKHVQQASRVRQLCYQDALLAYVHAMMPFDEVVALFKAFDQDEDGKITEKDVAAIMPEKPEGSEKKTPEELQTYQNFRTYVMKILLAEWGDLDKKSSFAEFKSYVRHLDLLSIIKRCQHNIACYQNMLVQYSIFFLTELDIWTVFQGLDHNKDGYLDEYDLRRLTTYPGPFLDIVAKRDKDRVTYEELRLFMRRMLVKHVLQETCRSKAASNKKHTCYKKYLVDMLPLAYKFAKISIPYSDVIYLFEYFDHNNDGEIKDDDLEEHEKNKDLRKKFLSETDSNNKGESANLEEFEGFLYYPTTIYALAGCLFDGEAKRTECFATGLMYFVDNMMSANQVEEFFKSYVTAQEAKKITKYDLEKKVPKGPMHEQTVEAVVKKMALGDDEITIFEFYSYVRHQDLQQTFDQCEKISEDREVVIKEKQEKLLDYILNRLTEYDIEMVYDVFDNNNDGEITIADLKKWYDSVEDCRKFLKAMDKDNDVIVDFAEFRFFMLMPDNRKVFEEECTIPLTKQKDENDCLFKRMWVTTGLTPPAAGALQSKEGAQSSATPPQTPAE